MNSPQIRVMTARDYDEVLAFLAGAEGHCPGPVESRESFITYLRRNPALSLVALERGTIVGCIFCGHDGWQGFLQRPGCLGMGRHHSRPHRDSRSGPDGP